MLVTMLVRLLCLTFHSPNQRIQPRDGKEQKSTLGCFFVGYTLNQVRYCSIFLVTLAQSPIEG
jgi:hypothetical protein